MNDGIAAAVLCDHAMNHVPLALGWLEVRHRLILCGCDTWRVKGDLLAVVEEDVAAVAWLLLIDWGRCHEFSSFFLSPNIRPNFAMRPYYYDYTAR